ncbi:sensor histidine kinase [Sutcliffiella rhizosphaerae]|uniref:histidine kinase n=1 Tax=Sutcliffiella rhizosphaerae TaxID=2880967 RepID=A0ABM8YNL4_9BACI|nr:sensor histidine kinase [Sutcliffiella rhizosphaerae]CAG9621575.1 Sensor histidine kinase GraS [Sutcliffiella rhizosphaerae]
MNKIIFIRFIKDRMLLVGFYLFNIISVITFFHLAEPSNTEIIYPFIVGLFLIVVYLLIDWFRYYHTNVAVEKMIQGQYTELPAVTEEQKAFHRLLQLNMKQYSKDKKEQLEKNKERLYFLSHWMHQLKTPVSVIDLLIQKGYANNNTLREIDLENKRLHSSIEQGLTMIRLDSFDKDLEISEVNLVTSLRKLINQRKSEFIHFAIFPVIDFQEKEVTVLTDSKWNEVVLDQLLSNAIKYSGLVDGNKKLIFSIIQKGEELILSLKDEGIGIPSYDIERVFDPFFTGENGRKVSNSTGIGLYLCKKIAKQLGHKLAIQSDGQKGTTVSIQYLTKL